MTGERPDPETLLARAKEEEARKTRGRLKLFFSILDLYEYDMLPLRRNLAPRALATYLPRWREAAELVKLVFRHKILRRPFSPKALYHPLAARFSD